MNKQLLINYNNYYLRVILQWLFRILSSFIPIKKNRILISCYAGKQYSCNPKYIVESLHQIDPNHFDIILSVSDPQIKNVIPQWMRTTKRYSLLCCYYYMSAKVIISNNSPSKIIPTKNNQILINTWHGGGAYKKVEKAIDNGNTKNFGSNIRHYYNRNTSAYISSSRLFTKYHIIEGCEYNGCILDTGMPRNDVFFYRYDKQKPIIDKVYQYLKIDKSKRIILYAPTMHDNTYTNQIAANSKEDKIENYWLDVKKLKETAHKRFGGEWVVALRAHFGRKSYISDTVDVSDYPDMQELLLATDILISDYSSSIWDFSFTFKPCFLYCYDLEKYDQERGFFTPIREWGFPVCQTFSSLIDAIRTFDETDYYSKMKLHHERFGSYEDGHASARIVEYILEQIDK